MAISGFGSGNYLRLTASAIAAFPCTMACWFRPTTNAPGGYRTLISVGAAAGGNNRLGLSITQTTGTLATFSLDNSGAAAGAVAAQVTANAWNFGCGRFASITSRQTNLNSGAAASNTTSNSPVFGSMGATAIGVHNNGGADYASTEAIAEAAIWNVVLSDEEVAALAAGVPSPLIRPAALVLYMPLVREIVGLKGVALPLVGSLAAADHCRVLGRA